MNNPPPTPNSHPHVADAVIADIAARKEMGLKKYGTPLQPFNGRRPLQDLYEELLDACHYLKQALMETDSIAELGSRFQFETIDVTSTPSTSDAGNTPKAIASENRGPSISAGGIPDRDTASSNSLPVRLRRRTEAEQINYLTGKVMAMLADRRLLESDRDTARASLAEARRAIEPFLRYQTPSWLADQPGIKVRVEVTLTELKAAHDWLAKNQPYHNPTEPGDAT